MTVTYGGRVPNGSTFGCFWKVLAIWRGSVYKLVWRELVAYLCIYYSINLIYRYALTESQQEIFAKIRLYFSQQSETIPMSFVLGFYVSLVVTRWWDQYKLLPWPDTLALFLNAGIPGANEKHRLMRRNIVRYAVLAYVITLQRVSLRVKKRFPTWQHVVDSGLMMESERKIFEILDQKTPMSKYWMPLVWATNIINRARKESIITSDHIVQTLLMELSDIRRRLGALIGYDTVNVPLVYTQVVSIALYSYFIAALLGRQFIPHKEEILLDKWEKPDMYFPVFTALQFCFYVGWLKVAEVLINPFGEDDDDIELNWLIDRHIKAAYMIVDEMHEEHPELLKDQFWDEVVPKELPYTLASEHYRKEEPKCSADFYKPKPQDSVYANVLGPKKSLLHEDMYADYESVDTPIVERRKSSNWFSRQISKTGMGSIRSASTAYSSGGLFTRHRGNSVYANPENGQLPGLPQAQKMSIYDRWVGRRSGRNKTLKSTSRLNVAAAMQVKNRPRIPTPDVTKEVVDRENRLSASLANVQNQMSAGLTLMPHQLSTNYTSYPAGDCPVVQVVLSPIQELDGTGSVNNTLHPNQPSTAALAQAVLSTGLGPVLTTPVSVPMTVSQLTSLGLASHQNSPLLARTFDQQSIRNPSFIQAFETRPSLTPTSSPLTLTEVNAEDAHQLSSRRNTKPPLTSTSLPLTLTEVNTEDAHPLSTRKSRDSVSSEFSNSLESHNTNTTISISSKKSKRPGDELDSDVVNLQLSNKATSIVDASAELMMPNSDIPDVERKASAADPSTSTPITSAPNSLIPLVAGSTGDAARIRKVSTISQTPANSNPPKREVYV